MLEGKEDVVESEQKSSENVEEKPQESVEDKGNVEYSNAEQSIELVVEKAQENLEESVETPTSEGKEVVGEVQQDSELVDKAQENIKVDEVEKILQSSIETAATENKEIDQVELKRKSKEVEIKMEENRDEKEIVTEELSKTIEDQVKEVEIKDVITVEPTLEIVKTKDEENLDKGDGEACAEGSKEDVEIEVQLVEVQKGETNGDEQKTSIEELAESGEEEIKEVKAKKVENSKESFEEQAEQEGKNEEEKSQEIEQESGKAVNPIACEDPIETVVCEPKNWNINLEQKTEGEIIGEEVQEAKQKLVEFVEAMQEKIQVIEKKLLDKAEAKGQAKEIKNVEGTNENIGEMHIKCGAKSLDQDTLSLSGNIMNADEKQSMTIVMNQGDLQRNLFGKNVKIIVNDFIIVDESSSDSEAKEEIDKKIEKQLIEKVPKQDEQIVQELVEGNVQVTEENVPKESVKEVDEKEECGEEVKDRVEVVEEKIEEFNKATEIEGTDSTGDSLHYENKTIQI